MSDLEITQLVRLESHRPSEAAYTLARRRLDERIAAERQPGRRRLRLAIPGVGLVCAAIAAAVVVLVAAPSRNGGEAAAARVLRHAAGVARVTPTAGPLEPGQYLYTRQEGESLGTDTDSPSFSVRQHFVREVWLGLEGGRLHETTGRAVFPSERDRRNWIASGRPRLPAGGTSDLRLPARRSDLPSDPQALYDRLAQEARGKSASFGWLMFQLIGDSLFETVTTREQRAALYEVAARVPEIELVGRVVDADGRPGLAVATLDESKTMRSELIIDPKTSALLAEEEVVLPGNSFGYPAGTVIGEVTYGRSVVVDSDRSRP